MTLDIGAIVAIVGVLFGCAGLVPFLVGQERKAKFAEMLATAQAQELHINAIAGARDDLAAKVTLLEKRVWRLEERNKQLSETIERAMRHERN